jgi:NADH-quinone oxidoreductase subunit F
LTYENVEGEQALRFADSLKNGTLPTDRDFVSYEEKIEAGICHPHDKAPRSAPREKKVILSHADTSGYHNDLKTYLKHGGYKILQLAVKRKPEDLCSEVELSGLRGRGGAGFPAGMKWKFLDRRSGKPIYLICNADESEPGTFKDRQIIYKDPHQLIESMMITAYAIQAKQAFIYVRGEFFEGARILERAIDEAKAKGFVGDEIAGSRYSCEIVVHRGAGAYICGEETGLIESLEGKRPYPRIKPPYFPAALGLYQCPTIVNNVETLCNVRHIVEMGGEKYAKLGHAGNTGTRIWCVSGHVKRPGYYEFQNGSVTLGEMIYEVCGGLLPGRTLKAVIPGGSSAKVLRAGERYQGCLKDGTEFDWSLEDVPLDFDGPMAAGSMSGSGGIIVMDDGVDMVEALANISAFYAHESCGQCTPCREGSLWLKKVTARMLRGEARKEDPDLLLSIANQIEGRTICAFGEACAWPVQSFVSKFKDDFAAKAGQRTTHAKQPFIPVSETIAK